MLVITSSTASSKSLYTEVCALTVQRTGQNEHIQRQFISSALLVVGGGDGGIAITEIRALGRDTKETMTLNSVFCQHRLSLLQYR